VDGLQITVLAFGQYPIDKFTGPIPWSLEPGTFKKMKVEPSSLVSYKSD